MLWLDLRYGLEADIELAWNGGTMADAYFRDRQVRNTGADIRGLSGA